MAKITPGALITDARGAQGTIVFARNRAGIYTRARVTPANPATTAQVAQRAAMTRCVAHWQTALTDAQREAWQSWADNQTARNTLGNRPNHAGFNAFMGCNLRINRQFGIFRDDPPDKPVGYQITTAAPAGSVSGASLTMNWLPAPTALPYTDVQVLTTGPLSAGRTRPTGTWNLLAAININAPTYNFYATFVAHSGAPTAGQKSFFRMYPFDHYTGARGSELRFPMVWSA